MSSISDSVAFTPKGGCPLKLNQNQQYTVRDNHGIGSIHPQGWVPIETGIIVGADKQRIRVVAFTPKGGCPLKPSVKQCCSLDIVLVAFTPKGGCPLKLQPSQHDEVDAECGSIHPQGWVPIETLCRELHSRDQ